MNLTSSKEKKDDYCYLNFDKDTVVPDGLMHLPLFMYIGMHCHATLNKFWSQN